MTDVHADSRERLACTKGDYQCHAHRMEGVYLLQVRCDNDFRHVAGMWFGLVVRCKLRADKQTDHGWIPGFGSPFSSKAVGGLSVNTVL